MTRTEVEANTRYFTIATQAECANEELDRLIPAFDWLVHEMCQNAQPNWDQCRNWVNGLYWLINGLKRVNSGLSAEIGKDVQNPTLPAATVNDRTPPRDHNEMMRTLDAMPIPQKTDEEVAKANALTQSMQDLADGLHQRNLANGLALAQQAAAGEGQLVALFAEIGRRYGRSLQSGERLA